LVIPDASPLKSVLHWDSFSAQLKAGKIFVWLEIWKDILFGFVC